MRRGHREATSLPSLLWNRLTTRECSCSTACLRVNTRRRETSTSESRTTTFLKASASGRDCRLPAGALLGKLNDGLRIAVAELAGGRIGIGSLGLGLGLALARAGHDVRVSARHERPVPAALAVTVGELPPWLSTVDVILLAVPDDAISGVAAALATAGLVRPAQTVLHLSGALGRDALAPLAPCGAALGSLHPLQSLSDPATAPQPLSGAIAAVEVDGVFEIA